MTNLNDFFTEGFDAAAVVAEGGDYVKLPEGNYKMYVEGFSIVNRPEKNQHGVMFNYVIMGGQYEGQNVRDQFLFVQDNDKGIKASAIGFAELSLACGFESPPNFDVMIGKTIMVEMKFSKDGKYTNPSKRYVASGSVQPSTLPMANQQAQSAAPAADAPKKMPWAK